MRQVYCTVIDLCPSGSVGLSSDQFPAIIAAVNSGSYITGSVRGIFRYMGSLDDATAIRLAFYNFCSSARFESSSLLYTKCVLLLCSIEPLCFEGPEPEVGAPPILKFLAVPDDIYIFKDGVCEYHPFPAPLIESSCPIL